MLTYLIKSYTQIVKSCKVVIMSQAEKQFFVCFLGRNFVRKPRLDRLATACDLNNGHIGRQMDARQDGVLVQ